MVKRVLPFVVLGLIAIAGFQWRIRHEMVDFGVYHQAAVRVTHAEPLYQAADGHYQFKYLPVFALLTSPLALVDADGAKMIWFALIYGALVVFVRWSVTFLPARQRASAALMGLTVLLMAKFYAHELTLGQANLLFGVLALGGIAAIQMEAPAVSGVLFGLAVCIKPYAALFGPWLLVTEGRRATVAFASTCALALVAPVVVYGPGGNVQLLLDWWHTVTASTAPNLTGADNISFAALGAKWLGPGLPARLVAGVMSAVGLGLIIDAWSRRKDVVEPAYLEAAGLLVLVPLLSPQGWDYVLLLATPAVALIIDRLPELSRPWRIAAWTALAVQGLVIFDLVGRQAYGLYMRSSIVTLTALTMIVVLNKIRRAKSA